MVDQIVYLIRHSIPQYPPHDSTGTQTTYGPEAGLTEEGKVKAMALAQKIMRREGRPLEVLITSPFRRTEQTAAILAAEMGIDNLIQDNRLRDIDSTWKGVPVEEFRRVFNEGRLFDDPRTVETLDKLGDRMKAVYDEALRDYTGRSIGIVSHGDPLRALFFRILHPGEAFPSYDKFIEMISFGMAEAVRLEITPKSIEWEKITVP